MNVKRTEQLALMPNKRKINDNELGYRERDGGKARSEKLILDQNKIIYVEIIYKTILTKEQQLKLKQKRMYGN